MKPNFIYVLKDNIYINLTNRCTALCTFCRRISSPLVCGFDLRLEEEPTVEQILEEIPNPSLYREVVFCGYGEPTLRLKDLLCIAEQLKKKQAHIRLNTNGHGNLIAHRSIVPDLKGSVDTVSVSLNAADEFTYERIVRPAFGRQAFNAVKDFILQCRTAIPRVVATVVALPDLDLAACRRLTEEELRVEFRLRALDREGME